MLCFWFCESSCVLWTAVFNAMGRSDCTEWWTHHPMKFDSVSQHFAPNSWRNLSAWGSYLVTCIIANSIAAKLAKARRLGVPHLWPSRVKVWRCWIWRVFGSGLWSLCTSFTSCRFSSLPSWRPSSISVFFNTCITPGPQIWHTKTQILVHTTGLELDAVPGQCCVPQLVLTSIGRDRLQIAAGRWVCWCVGYLMIFEWRCWKKSKGKRTHLSSACKVRWHVAKRYQLLC